MIFYKRADGEVFSFENESDREKYGDQSLVKMTKKEVDSHTNPPPPPVADILELVKKELRSRREPLLSAVMGIGWEASEAGDSTLVQEARNIRNALRDITDDPALNSAQTYEEMRAAGVAAYRRIAAGASPALRVVFREITGA